jgi:antitoxin component HigA of HigAB toxin-antitoxin module
MLNMTRIFGKADIEMSTTTSNLSTSDAYLELVLSFPLRPIRSAKTHGQAKKVLRDLIGKRGAAAKDYKAVLASLIADYERSAHLRLDTSAVSASEVVRHLLDERDLSVNALAKQLGISQSSLNDMLNCHRDWSKQAIIRISDFFGLQPTLFLK